MKSKKKLFEFFRIKYGKILNLGSIGISDETYGRKSYVYVYNCLNTFGVERGEVIKDLVAAGFKHPGDWGSLAHCTHGQGLEIRVSYFKGQSWYE